MGRPPYQEEMYTFRDQPARSVGSAVQLHVEESLYACESFGYLSAAGGCRSQVELGASIEIIDIQVGVVVGGAIVGVAPGDGEVGDDVVGVRRILRHPHGYVAWRL